MKVLAFFVSIIISVNVATAGSQPHGFTLEQQQWMAEQNHRQAILQGPTLFADSSDPLSFQLINETDVRAYAEYEEAGYLIFSETFDFDSKKAKLGMAENLPEDMTLIVYTPGQTEKDLNRVRKKFSDVIDEDRLKVVHIPNSASGFWARDGVPVPVIRSKGTSELFTVVDAMYYHGFEPDAEFSKLFNAELTKHDYFFEGGNFMANSRNECLVVNTSATKQIPDSIFEDHYGCKLLVRLPFIKGIGHVDESAKFIDDETVLTDSPQYKEILEENGFTVEMLPRPKRRYETYVNSLITNGVVFVPVFGQPTDEEALQVYRDMGLTAIGLPSRVLSNNGMGSIHCITMTYPNVPLEEMISTLGGTLLEK